MKLTLLVKPKFNIGDTVFYLKDNTIQEDTIISITTIFKEQNIVEKSELEFGYSFGIKSRFSEATYWTPENLVFVSKEELIKSL